MLKQSILINRRCSTLGVDQNIGSNLCNISAIMGQIWLAVILPKSMRAAKSASFLLSRLHSQYPVIFQVAS